jgi:hypothetical protein
MHIHAQIQQGYNMYCTTTAAYTSNKAHYTWPLLVNAHVMALQLHVMALQLHVMALQLHVMALLFAAQVS